MNFTAIDFETAIGKRWSICQVGIVRVVDGIITESLSSLVQPPNNEYSVWNTQVHGISAGDTLDAPTFPEIWDYIRPYIENSLVVAHNADFDIDCLKQTLNYYNLPMPDFDVDCTYKRTGQKLEYLCQAYDIEFTNHHDAVADALACAEVYMKLLTKAEADYSKVTIDATSKGFEFKGHERIKGDLLKPDLDNADSSSPFYGKKVVFTGALSKMTRHEAAEMVKKMGADIDTGISKKTDYVITGSAPGPSKMKKIEMFNEKGSQIQIILETEFLDMIE